MKEMTPKERIRAVIRGEEADRVPFVQYENAGGPNEEMLVFPSKFNRKLPDIPHPPVREVAYRFAGPVEDVYATLAVRLFYSDAFELKDLWKNAAELLKL